MPNHPRIECENLTNLTTIRSRNCEIWFTQNQELEQSILGNLAKFQARYGVTLYAFALEGTHKHEVARFAGSSRGAFFRDFNSSVTRSVQRFCTEFPGGNLWGGRYSNVFISRDEDIEEEFFYTVLQPVQDGLVENIDEYPGYNCFYDAIHGVEREFKVVDWALYNSHKRWKKSIDIANYVTTFRLKYSRLPGYEALSQAKYVAVMKRKLKLRTAEIVKKRLAEGKTFLGRQRLLQTLPGSRAKNPKKTTRWGFRPRIICGCKTTAALMLKWYFSTLAAHHAASYEYRIEGKSEAKFPPGTYRPPDFTCAYEFSHEDAQAAAAA
ncbi:MAG: hypothetical protein KDD60_01175 [Bdellovibrionales bacterium]|nr:hypothetical protein [Bdellovibrionales bacterium]